MNFDSLGLSAPLLKAVASEGYDTPSPIQAQAIPAVLKGRDVMAAAQTGTGKTAGFTLPLLQILSEGKKAQPRHIRALVLTPTRELAAQVSESVSTYGKHLPMNAAVVFGGVGVKPQIDQLRRGVDILVATPGRLLDLYQQGAVKFDHLQILVLDEADRMLDMGFIHDIKKLIAAMPKKRQNLMFSATFSKEIRALAKGLISDPVEISVSPNNTTADAVEQLIYAVDKGQRAALLASLITKNDWKQVLIFTRTKHGANKLSQFLESKKIGSSAIHGNKSQGARTRALEGFKNGTIRALVATDIAARGIDIDLLPHVVNYDLPNVPADYVHRIGRTGRAGATGQAVSLVCAEQFPELVNIEILIGKILPRSIHPDFEPNETLPESKKGQRPMKPIKADKSNGGGGNGGGRGRRGGGGGGAPTGQSARKSPGGRTRGQGAMSRQKRG